jgi:hypothetical protein
MLNIKRNAVAIAAIAVALSLPATSLALAQEGGEQTRAATIALKQHATKYKTYNTAQEPTSVNRRIYGQTPKADGEPLTLHGSGVGSGLSRL